MAAAAETIQHSETDFLLWETELQQKQPEQPQTHESIDRYRRIYNDTTTWLAETLDGSMRTPFEYTFDGRELYASDGSPLVDIFLDSVLDADRLMKEQPELGFEVRRRRHEFDEYGDMLKMARGELPNTMIIVSDFPPELINAKTSVGGYNVERKQTMLRVLTWRNGRLQMFSQSLDGSDRTALEAIYAQFNLTAAPGELLGQRINVGLSEEEQMYMTDRLTGVYDRSLAHQYGGEWHAGRPEAQHDTYQFVLSQHEVVDHFVMKHMGGYASDHDRYNVAALLSKRFEQFKRPAMAVDEAEVLFAAFSRGNMEMQLDVAGDEARAAGRRFDGCGVSVGGGSGSPQDQLNAAGYGNQSIEDKFGSLDFACSKGHSNTRPYGRLIERCQICQISVRC